MKLLSIALCAGVSIASTAIAMADEVGPELIVYSSAGIPADLAEGLIGPFAEYMDEKYGVPVNVQIVVGAVPQQWAAMQAEWPNPTGDVYAAYPEHIRTGIERGYWVNLQEHYEPEEWARFDQDVLAALDLDGYVAPQAVRPWALAVHNSVDEDLVTSFADLTRPELNRRFTFDSALSVGSGYNALAVAALILEDDWNDWFQDGQFDEEAARPAFELVASWAENALTLTQGSGSIRPLLQRGESLVSAWWWDTIMEEINSEGGADVRVVAPTEGVVSQISTGPIVTTASNNQTAAIEWVKFMHSDAARELAQELNHYAQLPRAGETGTPEWEELTSTANIVFIDDFRALVTDPAYNEQVLNFYNRIVVQGL